MDPRKVQNVESQPRLPMVLMRLIATFSDSDAIFSVNKAMVPEKYKQIIAIFEKFILADTIQTKQYDSFPKEVPLEASYYANKFQQTGFAIFPRPDELELLLANRKENPKQCLQELVRRIEVPLYLYLEKDLIPRAKRSVFDPLNFPKELGLMLQIYRICPAVFHSDRCRPELSFWSRLPGGPISWSSPMQICMQDFQHHLDTSLSVAIEHAITNASELEAKDGFSEILSYRFGLRHKWPRGMDHNSEYINYLIKLGANPLADIYSGITSAYYTLTIFSFSCAHGPSVLIKSFIKNFNLTNDVVLKTGRSNFYYFDDPDSKKGECHPYDKKDSLNDGLLRAAWKGNVETVQTLLESKADPNFCIRGDSMNPLAYALSQKGQTYTLVAHRLLEAKANPALVKRKSEDWLYGPSYDNAYQLAVKKDHKSVAQLFEQSDSPLTKEHLTMTEQAFGFFGVTPFRVLTWPEKLLETGVEQVSNFVSMLL